jgi:hypothetical protein
VEYCSCVFALFLFEFFFSFDNLLYPFYLVLSHHHSSCSYTFFPYSLPLLVIPFFLVFKF